ncbi:hypothetical protein LTR08_007308 [Meristemomyces frigidus]|nr:hypothetical protein LTR08_007308 [Meristemomyces frigidus]
MPNLIEQLDSHLAALLADWSLLTTALALALLAFIAHPILAHDEPDTHPLLLARQSTAAPIRNKRESAVYRAPETPYGYPLKTGLNVKAAGAPKWANGKDGDLRDVWREVMRGGVGVGEDGRAVPRGGVMTVLGREEVVEEDLGELTRQIGVVGRALRGGGVRRVAVYLPNSVEYLLAIFACAFYGITPVLLPYNQPHPKVYELLNATDADALICAAGNLPLDGLAKQCPALRQLTWVVEKTSRHMDWSGAPGAAHDHLQVSVWHDLVGPAQAQDTPPAALPTNDDLPTPPPLISVWQPADPQLKPTLTTFTAANLVAAIAALLTALPLRQRLTPADLVLPADGFAHSYILCHTLAALYTHSAVALTSVAGPGVDLALASRALNPTVILASASSLALLHARESAARTTLAARVGKYTQGQTMAAGRMPTEGLLSRFLAPSPTASGTKPGALRLILTSERLGYGTPPLTSTMLSDLRTFTRARICYALTAAEVAGAITQSHVFDYRRVEGRGCAQFGVPVACVEVKLVAESDGMVAGPRPRGAIVVSGPGVSGGVVRLSGVEGRVGEDGTLGYA